MKPKKNYNRNVKILYGLAFASLLLGIFGGAIHPSLALIGIMGPLAIFIWIIYLKHSTAQLVPAKYRRHAYYFLFYEFILMGIFFLIIIVMIMSII